MNLAGKKLLFILGQADSFLLQLNSVYLLNMSILIANILGKIKGGMYISASQKMSQLCKVLQFDITDAGCHGNCLTQIYMSIAFVFSHKYNFLVVMFYIEDRYFELGALEPQEEDLL